MAKNTEVVAVDQAAITAKSTEELRDQIEVWVEAGYITEATPTSLELHPDTPKDVWQAVGHHLTVEERLHKAALSTLQWWRGDWLRHGEWAWGEKYDQACEATGFAERTLQNCQWVADRFTPDRRRPNVSFGHHSAVASLPPRDADRLLDRAEEEDLLREDLREEKRRLKDRAQGKDPDVEEARRAMGRAVDALADVDVKLWPGLVVNHFLDEIVKRYKATAPSLAERVATWAAFTKG